MAEVDEEVEGEPLTLERAAGEYFVARERRLDQRQRAAVQRFVSWCGRVACCAALARMR